MRSVLLGIAVLLLAAGCSNGSDDAATASRGGASSTTSTTDSPMTSTSQARPSCEHVATPPAREPVLLQPPKTLLAKGKTYTLTFDTNCGTFSVQLDTGLAPHTSASLVSLARRGYYNDTDFLRIVPRFVIQAGDPTETGAGQPGYSTIDVPPRGTRYTKGTVGMAKSQLDGPGTAGSQFFIVTAKKVKLDPVYAVVGKVTSGLETVERIGKLGTAKGLPTQAVVIKTVKVDVSP